MYTAVKIEELLQVEFVYRSPLQNDNMLTIAMHANTIETQAVIGDEMGTVLRLHFSGPASEGVSGYVSMAPMPPETRVLTFMT